MSNKNQEIESLRAVAVLLTMASHAFALFRWHGNPWGDLLNYVNFWGGVDIFFCISGYVISKSFIESLDNARATGDQWRVVKAFWVRRAYRLLPSAWFWLAFSLFCAFLVNKSGAFGPPDKAFISTMSVLTLTGNFAHAFGIDLNPNGVYWSLALEEQFYFALPFFLILAPLKWRWRLLLAAIALQFPFPREYVVDASWFFRLDAIMWGVLIYMFSRTREYRIFEPKLMANPVIGMTSSIALIAAVLVLPATLRVLPFHVGMMAVASAVLVFAASFGRGYVLPVGTLRPVFTWMGSRSYALYLTHIPAYYLTNEIWYRLTVGRGLPPTDGTYTLRYGLTALFLVIVLSEFNYRVVETPLRKKGAQIAKTIRERSTDEDLAAV